MSAKAHMAKQLLPAIDNFDLAVKNSGNSQEFIEGVELTYSQLIEALKIEGLQKIDPKGQKFDPNQHEIIGLKLSASWCGPCRMNSFLEGVQKTADANKNVKIFSIDVDKHKDLVKKYGVSGQVPEMIFLNSKTLF